MHECERLQERITRLASGIAVIRVGAATEIEMIEKKHRIDDALEAVRSAQEEGIVPGGGVALLRAVTLLSVETDNEEQALGAQIVLKACEAPLRTMARNAGESEDIIIERVREGQEGDEGYDFLNRRMVSTFDRASSTQKSHKVRTRKRSVSSRNFIDYKSCHCQSLKLFSTVRKLRRFYHE